MEIDNTCTASNMIRIYKPMIRKKMEQNIDIRAEAAASLINNCIETIINDTQQNNIMKLIELHNPSLNIKPFDLNLLKDTSKQKLYTKVNEWKGLANFKNKANNIKSYKKNADGWWNRKKPDLLGEHFFYPLLHSILPQYIKQNIIGINNLSANRYGTSNPLHLASYDLIFFSILYEIFHEEIAFARTKFFPLILDQCFIQSKCRHTLQQLLVTLGDRHNTPWNNKGVTKSENARNYARQWVSKILTKIRISYKEITQSHPQPILGTYNEINMCNDNDINTPSISYSMSSEAETRDNLNVFGGGLMTNNMLEPSPFTLNPCNNNNIIPTHIKEPFSGNMIVNNDPLPMYTHSYNSNAHFNDNNTCYNNNNNNQFVAPINMNNEPLPMNTSLSNGVCFNDNNSCYTNNSNNNNSVLTLPTLVCPTNTINCNNNTIPNNNNCATYMGSNNNNYATYTPKPRRQYAPIRKMSHQSTTPIQPIQPTTPSMPSDPSGFSLTSFPNESSLPPLMNYSTTAMFDIDTYDMDHNMFDNEPMTFDHNDTSIHFVHSEY